MRIERARFAANSSLFARAQAATFSSPASAARKAQFHQALGAK
jgi:hypothetical protein